MKEKGIMKLIVGNREIKMHYAVIDGKIYTSTGSDTKKIEEIKHDNIVRTDLSNYKYAVTILNDEIMLDKYRNKMGRLNKLINIYLGSKTPVLLELNEIK